MLTYRSVVNRPYGLWRYLLTRRRGQTLRDHNSDAPVASHVAF
jgi:hypothetical protein